MSSRPTVFQRAACIARSRWTGKRAQGSTPGAGRKGSVSAHASDRESSQSTRVAEPPERSNEAVTYQSEKMDLPGGIPSPPLPSAMCDGSTTCAPRAEPCAGWRPGILLGTLSGKPKKGTASIVVVSAETGKLAERRIWVHNDPRGLGGDGTHGVTMLQAGTMDLDPIYCAEQIHVPPERRHRRRTLRRWCGSRMCTNSPPSISGTSRRCPRPRETFVPPTLAMLKETRRARPSRR